MLELQPIVVPFDTIYEILQHCDNLTALANFALTNKTYRSASEPLLYGSLEFDNEDLYSGRLEKCLATLSDCPQKALYSTQVVLRLDSCNLNDVRYDYSDDSFFGYLATALIAVGNLQTLVLKLEDFMGIKDIKTRVLLCPILRKCTFSLHTIIVPECIEPALWAQRHDNLRDILIYYHPPAFPDDASLQIYEKWTTESSYMLTVSGCGPFGCFREAAIMAFPIFKPRWSAQPITTLLKCVMGYQPYIEGVDLFVHSIKTETFLKTMISVAECFPYAHTLDLSVADGEIYETSGVFLEAISSLPELRNLALNAMKEPSSKIGPQQRIEMQRLCGLCCPLLTSVYFSHDDYGGGNFRFSRERGCDIWNLESPQS